jgi:hypothetical protein
MSSGLLVVAVALAIGAASVFGKGLTSGLGLMKLSWQRASSE